MDLEFLEQNYESENEAIEDLELDDVEFQEKQLTEQIEKI